MNLSELWRLYEADKRIQGFSPKTLAYEETYLTSNLSLKLREPKLEKRIPKFLIEHFA